MGDAAEIHRKRERKQKTDRQDAQHILRLLLKDDFPRIWVPSGENRDLRQLLWHRHRMVQARTRLMNQLQAVALNEGLRCKKRLWREQGREQLESFRLARWASRRRHDLLELLDRLNPAIAELRARSGEVSCGTALDDPSRSGSADRTGVRADHRESGSVSVWQADRELSGTGAAGGLERESATDGTYHETRELSITLPAGGSGASNGAQPSGMAQQVCPPDDAARKIAKVAMARKLAVRLYWMMRKQWNYEQLKKFGSHAGQPGNRDGVKQNIEKLNVRPAPPSRRSSK